MIREEDNTLGQKIQINKDDDIPTGDKYPFEAFLQCYQMLISSFNEKSLRDICSNLISLFGIVKGLDKIPYEVLEQINFHEFFFDLFQIYELHITFPHALRVLNFVVCIDDFEPKMLATEQFFNILIDEVLPHITQQNMPIELICNLIINNPEARDQLIAADIIGTFCIPTYPEKNNESYRRAVNKLLTVVLSTEPYPPMEYAVIIADFVIDQVMDIKILSSSIAEVLYAVLAFNADLGNYTVATIQQRDQSFDLLRIYRDISEEYRIYLLKSIEVICTYDDYHYADQFFWPYVVNLISISTQTPTIVEVIDVAIVVISTHVYSIIGAFKQGLVDLLFQMIDESPYPIKVKALKFLSFVMIREPHLPGVGTVLLKRGYLELARDYLTENDVKRYIIEGVFNMAMCSLTGTNGVQVRDLLNADFISSLQNCFYNEEYSEDEYAKIGFILQRLGLMNMEDDQMIMYMVPENEESENEAEEEDEGDGEEETAEPFCYRKLKRIRLELEIPLEETE